MAQGQEIKVGDTFTIYCGEAYIHPPSHYLPMIAEQMDDRAAEVDEDNSENWLTDCDDQLQKAIGDAVDAWCKDNGHWPRFGAMRNIGAVEIKVTHVNGDNDGFDWDFSRDPPNSAIGETPS